MMIKNVLPILILAAVAGCDEGPPELIRSDAKGEPKKVRVLHVLVAFEGAQRAPATVRRTHDEAEVLAEEILARARRGEDFKKLIKDYSTDSGEGNYIIVNHGYPSHGGEVRRATFAAEFTRVAFSLQVGEVGLAAYDPKDSPFGFHVIKRIE